MCSGLSCTHVSWIILRYPACFVIRVACGDPEMGKVCMQANISCKLAVSTMCPLQGRAVSFIPFCRIWADLAILIGSDEAFCRICLTETPANPANTFVRSVRSWLMASTSLLDRTSSALKSNNKVLLWQTYNDLSAKISSCQVLTAENISPRLGRHTEISVPRRPTCIYHKYVIMKAGKSKSSILSL